jgi:hypothetical protein
MGKRKRTNNDLQIILITPIKPEVSSGASEGCAVPVPLVKPVVYIFFAGFVLQS